MEDQGQLFGSGAVVTGGGSGIGEGIALALAAAGAAVVVADLDEASAAGTVTDIETSGGQAKTYRLDVSNPDEVQALLDFAVDSVGPVRIMANIAGVAGRRVGGRLPVLDTTEDDFTSLMRINVLSVLTGSQAAARVMREHGRGGLILNASSGSVDTAAAGLGLYAMSKAAVAMLSKTLAVELAPDGIRVNAIAPWLTRTSYFSEFFDGPDDDVTAAARTAAQYFSQAAASNPMGRLCTPADIGALAVFLASDGGAYLSGQLIRANGAAATPW